MNPAEISRLACALLLSAILAPECAEAQYGRHDYAITHVEVTNDSYSPGDRIYVHVEIRNVGQSTGAQVSVPIWIYASRNDVLTPEDIELRYTDVSVIGHETSQYDLRGTLPHYIAVGDYYIGAKLAARDLNPVNDARVDQTPITIAAPAADAFLINEGLSDAWYDPERPGQGFFITVYPDIQKVFLGWFTFDSSASEGSGATALLGDPNHRWLTALGPYTGNTAALNIELTQGGIFNTTPPETTQSSYGTISLTFANCNEAELIYKLLPGISAVFFPRAITLQRTYASPDNLALCEELQSP